MGDLLDLAKILSAPTLVPTVTMLALMKIFVVFFGNTILFNPVSQMLIVLIASIMMPVIWSYMLKGVDMEI